MSAGVADNEGFWQAVEARAAALGSDGCTHASEWNRRCCLLHDVMLRTGMDMAGHPVSRHEADWLFWECNRVRARAGLSYLSPRSWIRYAGVRIGAWQARRRRQGT